MNSSNERPGPPARLQALHLLFPPGVSPCDTTEESGSQDEMYSGFGDNMKPIVVKSQTYFGFGDRIPYRYTGCGPSWHLTGLELAGTAQSDAWIKRGIRAAAMTSFSVAVTALWKTISTPFMAC